MTTLFVDAAAWDNLDPADQAAAIVAARIPVTLGEPARLVGTFDAEGLFVADDTGPEWCAWDDPRLTDDHAITIAAALEP